MAPRIKFPKQAFMIWLTHAVAENLKSTAASGNVDPSKFIADLVKSAMFRPPGFSRLTVLVPDLVLEDLESDVRYNLIEEGEAMDFDEALSSYITDMLIIEHIDEIESRREREEKTKMKERVSRGKARNKEK